MWMLSVDKGHIDLVTVEQEGIDEFCMAGTGREPGIWATLTSSGGGVVGCSKTAASLSKERHLAVRLCQQVWNVTFYIFDEFREPKLRVVPSWFKSSRPARAGGLTW